MQRGGRRRGGTPCTGAGGTLVGLDAPVTAGVHRGEVRVGDHDLVAEGFEVAGDPLTLGARFDQDARGRARAEHLADVLAVSLDAALNQLVVFGQDADLAGDLAEVETDEINRWFSFASRSVPQNVRSSMLPRVAASRFIQSFVMTSPPIKVCRQD